MQRIEIRGPQNAQLVNVREPEHGPDDVVLSVKACGICGSDIHFLEMGGLIPEMVGTPLPIGHEFSGTVIAVGKNVAGIGVGDRLVAHPVKTGGVGIGGPDGAFGPRVTLRGVVLGENVFHVPDGLSFAQAALVEPLNVGMKAVDRSELSTGEKVVVFGAGPIGLSVVAVLAHRGFRDVVAIDLSDHRLSIAKQLGAEHVLNGGAEDLWDRLAEIHGTSEIYGQPFCGTDVFIEASGAGFLIPTIVSRAKFGARLTLVAGYGGDIGVSFNDVMSKQMDIRGSYQYPDDFSAPLELLQAIDTEPMISHRFPLEKFADAMAAARDSANSAKVIVEPSSS